MTLQEHYITRHVFPCKSFFFGFCWFYLQRVISVLDAGSGGDGMPTYSLCDADL